MSSKSTKNREKRVKKVHKCRECKENVVSEDEDSIECNKCKHWIHYQCCALNKTQLNKLIEEEEEEYHCHYCKPKSSSNDDIAETLQTLIRKVDDLTSSVKFLGDNYDDFYKQFKQQEKKIKALEKENKDIRATLNQVLYDQKTLFSEVNRNKVIIKGINTTSTDNTAVKNLVVEMASKGGSSITADDISEVNILLRNRNNPSRSRQVYSSIVTFKSFLKKLDLVTKRKTIKGITEFKDISIMDLLPKSSQKLYTHALALKNVGFAAVYHQNGVIFAKKTKDGSPIIIKTFDCVDNLLKKSCVGDKGRKGKPISDTGTIDEDDYESVVSSGDE